MDSLALSGMRFIIFNDDHGPVAERTSTKFWLGRYRGLHVPKGTKIPSHLLLNLRAYVHDIDGLILDDNETIPTCIGAAIVNISLNGSRPLKELPAIAAR